MLLNPIALRVANTTQPYCTQNNQNSMLLSFGHSECNRVKDKFLLLRVDPILERLCLSGKGTKSDKSSLVEKYESVSIHLKSVLRVCMDSK